MKDQCAGGGDMQKEAIETPRLWATSSFNSASNFASYSYQLAPHTELVAVTGHSTVHKCYSLVFGRYVAIKIIDKKSIPASLVEKFLPRELEITKKVNHPHIIRCLHVIQPHPTKVVIISEFCDGGTLLKYVLDYNGLVEKESARLFRQLIEAVHYLHTALSIAHRDIKLENILLDSFRTLKLADFGFAREASKSQKSNSYCGTRPYSAPQLVDHYPYEPFAADWFACGIALYTMIAGNWPHEPWEKIIYPVKYPINKISFPARQLIDSLIQKNEEMRGGYMECCISEWLSTLTADGNWIVYDHHNSMIYHNWEVA